MSAPADLAPGDAGLIEGMTYTGRDGMARIACYKERHF